MLDENELLLKFPASLVGKSPALRDCVSFIPPRIPVVHSAGGYTLRRSVYDARVIYVRNRYFTML